MATGTVSGDWHKGRAGFGRGCLAGICLILLFWGAPEAKAVGCPNEEFRTGLSATLPACRAYELVSPADSDGRLLQSINTWETPPASPERFPTELVAPSGDSAVLLTYMSALPQARGAIGIADMYEAQRGPQGWITPVRLGPSGFQAISDSPGGVSSDHSYTTTVVGPGSLSEKGGASYLFGRDGSVEPVGLGSLAIEPFALGRFISTGGEHIIFSTGKAGMQSNLCFFSGGACKVAQLEPNAPPTGTGAIYDRSAEGPTHVVSLLPGDVPLKAGEQSFYKGNSKNGTSVAFEVAGALYVRIHSGSPGEEATQTVTEGAAAFAGISDQGRYVFYIPGGEKGTIQRYDTLTEEDTEINPGTNAEIVNISGDGSHVYFISEEELAGHGTAGEPNLYVWAHGTLGYVTTVAPSDLEQTSQTFLPGETAGTIPALTRWTSWVTNVSAGGAASGLTGPGADSSRSTPDGTVLVFESRAQLTSYDNDSHTEVYRYDDEAKSLVCVSCNVGQAATQDARLQELRFVTVQTVVHNLSDDGSALFFETKEPLVARDTDGVNDIYEWHEEGGGEGSVDLISSGQSVAYPEKSPFQSALTKTLPPANVLYSVTPNGSNVLFFSQDVLTQGAPESGTTSIYDARIGGGFPTISAPAPCLEDACKPSATLPSLLSTSPGSESLNGSGNLKPRKHHRHCRPKNRKKKAGCGKKRKHPRRQAVAATVSVTKTVAQEPASNQSDPTTDALQAPEGQVAAAAVPPSSKCGPEEGRELKYGLEGAAAGLDPSGAGLHPEFTSEIVLNHCFVSKRVTAPGRTEEVIVSLPPGLLGDPNAVPRCKIAEFLTESCPIDSQVGTVDALVVNFEEMKLPIYNLELPHPEREIARFAFFPVGVAPVYLDIKIRTAGDYGATGTVYGPSGFYSLVSARTILWGNPSDPAHDDERLVGNLCEEGCPVPRTEKAFMTNPSACQAGQVMIAAKSYQLPGQVFEGIAPLPATTDCTGLPFAPTFEAEPTSHQAGAPTGLKTVLKIPQHLSADEKATATMREARVTLPAGMQVAAGAANWVGTCSDSQVGFHEEVDTHCPDSSKLGTATIKSPALSVPIEGTIYQRSPQPGHQLGLWLASDALGLHVKLPGELEPDKTTGRLTAVFRGLPQVPVEEIDLDVWGGPRAPLQNPDHCGTYTTDFSFSPHSDDPAASGQSQMQISKGCNQPFSPTLKAGVTEPVAGKFSPLVVDLNREDGNQALRGFELHLPDGELAKPAGVPLCSDAEAAAGTCPPGSRIGSLTATAGPGPEPFTIPEPGKARPAIYFAGPYKGAPFSVVSEVPAQAGPFDLGTLAVRSALEVEPETGRAVVKADPLPQFFEGVGIAYRHIHAVVDRPEFNLNPTDCREMAVTADVASTQGTVVHPQTRFQVDGCKALKFRPRLSLKLKGGTKRAQYPAFNAVLRARKGDANIAFTSVALPHSEFIAQEHFDTICTRKQFAADKCPKGSVYGTAKAFTPLLEKPLSGPVYLRSSDHPLPDLVVKLGGQLEIDLVGRVDSVHGGLRASFESVPDAPVSKFVMHLKGGRKGLFVNSTDICRGSHRATVRMRAQNGRAVRLRPQLLGAHCQKNNQS